MRQDRTKRSIEYADVAFVLTGCTDSLQNRSWVEEGVTLQYIMETIKSILERHPGAKLQHQIIEADNWYVNTMTVNTKLLYPPTEQ